MASMKIGRLDLQVEPAEWSITRGFDSNEYVFRGFLMATSVAQTRYIRDELIGHLGDLVPIIWDTDPSLTGFYYLVDIRIESVPMSYLRRGLFPFEVNMFRVGGESSTELQSLITAGDRNNDFGTTPTYWHATPPGALAYECGDGSPTEYERESEDGTVLFYEDVSPDVDPKWAIAPDDYYNAACKIYFDDLIRCGTELPDNDPTNWYISNGLIQCRAEAFQSTSDGTFSLRLYDGSAWDSWVSFKVTWSDQVDIPQWHYFNILRNDPECVAVRLTRDAVTSTPSARRHTLDFALRRGSHYVECIYTYSQAQDHAVYRATADAASHPGGTASYIADADTIDGHRWIIGMPYDFNADTTNGGMDLVVGSTFMPFFVGFVKNNAANGSADGPADLTQQYTGVVVEKVRAVAR